MLIGTMMGMHECASLCDGLREPIAVVTNGCAFHPKLFGLNAKLLNQLLPVAAIGGEQAAKLSGL